jgi:hypothetical protein
LFYKILYAFYPFGKREKVLAFYKGLIETNEISFLLDLLNDYHKEDIIKYVNQSKDEKKDDETWWHRSMRNQKKSIKKTVSIYWLKFARTVAPWSRTNRKLYANIVLYNVINDPAFVELAANQRPYLFFEIFASFKELKRRAYPDELINRYLVELLKQKNFWLIKELKECERFDSGQPEGFFEENKILASLFADLGVSDVNEIWRPFGEAAHEEIDEERLKGLNGVLYNEFTDEKALWNFKTFIAIKFFEYLIVEAVIKKHEGTHFWLYYYERITEAILDTFSKHNVEPEVAMKSIYYKFIDIMLSNVFRWLDLANQTEDQWRYHDILSCLGGMVHDISRNPHVDDKTKIALVDRMLNVYCNLDENSQTDSLRAKFEEVLLRPSMLTDGSSPYYIYFEQAWKDFDTIPYRIMGPQEGDYGYFSRLKDKVIIPLGLDPDEPY